MFMTGGELLARALRRAGVEVVFALHGGHLDPFFLGCAREGIRLVDGRHEAAVGNAADGYARATGRIGVAAVTAGAGFANVLPAIVSAHVDRVPLLVVTSSPPLREAELNELQGGVDQTGIVGPITRWAHRVTTVERVPDLARAALRHALGVPPGPVLLDVAVDVVHRTSDVEDAGGGAVVQARVAPDAPAIAEAADLLRRAERPAVVVGNGIRWSRAGAAVAAFAEAGEVPVFSQVNTVGLAANHPLNAHSAWHMTRLEPEAGARPDVVLLVGARMGRYLGGRSGTMIPDDARVIQVDVDPTEIGRLRPIDVGVVADARLALEALTAQLAEPFTARKAWAERATAVAKGPSTFHDDPHEIEGRMHPYHAVRAALLEAGPAATVVVDGGEAAGWVWENLPAARPRDVIGFAGYLGILGLAMGQAVGAQVARPGERVVLFCGDGAAGFHIQELDTMVRHDLPVVMVVVNNAVWGQSVRAQARRYGPEGEVISHLSDTDYGLVARGFGAHGERVTKVADVRAATRRALDAGGPALLDLAVAYGPEPRTAAGMGKKPKPGHVALPYYESVPDGGSEGNR